MKTVYSEKKNCCGCTACQSVCPKNAIRMLPDEEGFRYPEIDESSCINCGLCIKVCPIISEVKLNTIEPAAYAVKHKKNNIRMTSTSGGMYTALSDIILNQGGILYGAAYNEKFQVQHNKAVSTDEREALKGTKYIQSDLGDIFIRIRKDLKEAKAVLFTGTACQVAGLKNYLEITKTNTDRLFLNDLICHGVSSPKLWDEYLKFIQKEDKLVSYTFRNKAVGWHGLNIKAEYANGQIKINNTCINVYADLYATELILRPSCYECKFANINRCSDITIGDFWGIEKSLPEFDDNKGVSLVLVNSTKGDELFSNIESDVNFLKSNLKDCLQPNLVHPTERPKNRSIFWDDYSKSGFKYIVSRYTEHSVRAMIKRLVIKLLKILHLYNIIRRIKG